MAAMRVRRYLSGMAVALMRRLAALPIHQSRRYTARLGGLMYRLMRRRRRVAEANLAVCFPDQSADERRRLLRRHFTLLAEGLAEISWAWAGSSAEPVGEVVGLEHLHRASEAGGVLMVTGHCTCLEAGGRLLGSTGTMSAMYRPLRNPVFEAFQNEGRSRYAHRMFRRDDLRGAVRYLRAGGIIWYAPDQDFGPARSLFAPFFGVPAATLKATVELARMGRASVVPMYPVKDPDTGWIRVQVGPAFENLPSTNPVDDLTRINAWLEAQVRAHPAQYWWLHRRFKTRPEGAPPIYRGP